MKSIKKISAIKRKKELISKLKDFCFDIDKKDLDVPNHILELYSICVGYVQKKEKTFIYTNALNVFSEDFLVGIYLLDLNYPFHIEDIYPNYRVFLRFEDCEGNDNIFSIKGISAKDMENPIFIGKEEDNIPKGKIIFRYYKGQ